jgi:hypothetical protein
MKRVEDVLLAEDEDSGEFRRSLIAQIGAAKLERPEESVDYQLLFGAYMKRLEEDYYAQHKKTIEKVEQAFLRMLDSDVKDIDPKTLERARSLKDSLIARGYNESSAKSTVAYLLKRRR